MTPRLTNHLFSWTPRPQAAGAAQIPAAAHFRSKILQLFFKAPDAPIQLEDLRRVGGQGQIQDNDTARPANCYTQREEERKLNKPSEAREMKFSHSIQFNSVPDWNSHYINYSNLKKLIYTLEKAIHQAQGQAPPDAEASPLLGHEEDPDPIFRRALDAELEKICSFYQLKELEIFGEVEELKQDAQNFEADTDALDHDQAEAGGRGPGRASKTRHMSMFKNFGGFGHGRDRQSNLSPSMEEVDEDGDSNDDDATPLKRSIATLARSKTWDANADQSIDDLRSSRELPTRRRRQSQAFEDYSEEAFTSLFASSVALKKRTVGLYTSLCELKSFIQLNKTGFTKALKKFDKILDRNLKSKYLKESVNPAYPFRETTMQRLDEHIQNIERLYARVVTQGDVELAKRELRLHLREHVVWERNTVWREMIGIERKAQAANMGVRRTLLGGDHDPANARLQGDDPDEMGTKEVVTPVGRVHCPNWLLNSSFFLLLGIIAVFVVLLSVPIMKKPEQQNCLALLAFTSLLWATEVIPLFVTSLLVPFLVVILRIVRSDDKPHHRLQPPEATKYVFASMWTPVIMLLLGGFTIAAALSKYNIAKLMATFVLSKAGTKPRTVLLTNMFVAMVASMWISNVAAPVLCFSIIQPLLRNLPNDSEFSKALILGIALASNIGGAASPIASPQNIIALHIMSPQPSWGEWFAVSLPVCIVSIILIWLFLLATFRPGKGTNIAPIRPMKDKFTGIQYFISGVTLVTIVLWCVSHQLEAVFGDMGVIAILPMIVFFGSGILTKEDFNNFLWTIVILAAGGLSLGKAVSSSGLLHTIAGALTDKVEGLGLYSVLVVFCSLILVVATFISHTVSALIILPLVHQVGAGMKDPHPNLLVMASVLICSAAAGLPTSGFPNMTAIMMEDGDTGKRYLRVSHFLTRGIPSSIIAFVVIITLGYGLLLAAKF
ncbi:MAG: hypothetical protein LQ346_008585 [Caloplaca aetnensis]|nr:MAG: hypothetical protein LQ346_008585 [Caloplaca aetnensis]